MPDVLRELAGTALVLACAAVLAVALYGVDRWSRHRRFAAMTRDAANKRHINERLAAGERL